MSGHDAREAFIAAVQPGEIPHPQRGCVGTDGMLDVTWLVGGDEITATFWPDGSACVWSIVDDDEPVDVDIEPGEHFTVDQLIRWRDQLTAMAPQVRFNLDGTPR